MSDPLSISVAVIGIATASLKVSKLLLSETAELVNAHETLQTLHDDVSGLNDSIVSIKAIQEPEWKRIGEDAAGQTKIVLSKCGEICSTCRDSLARWTRHSQDNNLSIRDRFQIGLFKGKEIVALSQQLQIWKLSLTQTVGLANLHSSLRIGSTIDDIISLLVSFRNATAAAHAQFEGQVEAIRGARAETTLRDQPDGNSSDREDKQAAVQQLEEQIKAIAASQILIKELAAKFEHIIYGDVAAVTQQNSFGGYNRGVQVAHSSGSIVNNAGGQHEQGDR